MSRDRRPSWCVTVHRQGRQQRLYNRHRETMWLDEAWDDHAAGRCALCDLLLPLMMMPTSSLAVCMALEGFA